MLYMYADDAGKRSCYNREAWVFRKWWVAHEFTRNDGMVSPPFLMSRLHVQMLPSNVSGRVVR